MLRDSHIFADGEIWRDVVWVDVQGDDLVEDGGTGTKTNEDETAHKAPVVREPLRERNTYTQL